MPKAKNGLDFEHLFYPNGKTDVNEVVIIQRCHYNRFMKLTRRLKR